AKCHRQLRLGQIAAGWRDESYLRRVAANQLDRGAYGVVVLAGADQFDAYPMMRELLVVAKQSRSAARCGQKHVEVPVAINIGIGGAAADHRADEVGAALFGGQ